MKITKIDHIIYIGACTIFIYFFFFVSPTPIYEQTGVYQNPYIHVENPNTTGRISGYSYSAIVIIAPIIAIAWLFMILYGEDIPRLRDMSLKKHIQTKISWIKETHHLQQKTWKNRHRHNHLHKKTK